MCVHQAASRCRQAGTWAGQGGACLSNTQESQQAPLHDTNFCTRPRTRRKFGGRFDHFLHNVAAHCLIPAGPRFVRQAHGAREILESTDADALCVRVCRAMLAKVHLERLQHLARASPRCHRRAGAATLQLEQRAQPLRPVLARRACPIQQCAET